MISKVNINNKAREWLKSIATVKIVFRWDKTLLVGPWGAQVVAALWGLVPRVAACTQISLRWGSPWLAPSWPALTFQVPGHPWGHTGDAQSWCFCVLGVRFQKSVREPKPTGMDIVRVPTVHLPSANNIYNSRNTGNIRSQLCVANPAFLYTLKNSVHGVSVFSLTSSPAHSPYH